MMHNVRSHRKFTRLVRRLRSIVNQEHLRPEGYAVCLLENLWYMASISAIRGDIGKFSDEEIAEDICWNGEPSEIIEILVECGWIDRCDVHRLVIHDWHDHAPNYVKGNAKKAGGIVTGEIKENPQRNEAEPKADSGGASSGARRSPPNLTLPDQTQPPPTCQEAEEVLRKLGVDQAPRAVETATARGVTTREIYEICRHFVGKSGAWNAGALYQRVLNAYPGESPSEHWPTPAKSFQIRGDPEAEARKAAESERLAKSRRFVQRRKELRECEPEHRHRVLADEFGEAMVGELGSDVESISAALKKVTQGGLA